LKEIIQNYRSFGPAYRLLGNVYNTKGEIQSGKEYIIRAGDLADFAPPVDTLVDKLALMSRSELYLLKQIDEAERTVYPEYALKLIENARAYIPDNKYLISKTIKLLLKLDSGNDILPYIKQHFNYFKDDFPELKQVADLLYEKGYFSQSLIYYQRISTIKQEDPEIFSSLALVFLNTDRKQQALDLVDEFVEKYHENPKILANAAYLMLMANEQDKALAYLDMLKRLAPSNPKMFQLTGIIAEQEGNLQKAITMYELAFKGNPQDLVSIQSLGEILMKQRMWERSVSHLEKAMEYHPNEPYLLERLGTLLVACPDIKVRDYNQGKVYSERAFIHKACPTETMISAGRSLAEAYAGLGDKKNAYIYMNIIYEMAQSQHAPEEFLEEIRGKLRHYAQ
jgi:tetratricopeptide (TPR) repeat protein